MSNNALAVTRLVLTSIVVVPNFIGNALVCLVVLRYKTLRTLINFLLVHLAITDILVGIFAILKAVLDVAIQDKSVMNVHICKLISNQHVVTMGVASSYTTIIIVSVLRYYGITKSLKFMVFRRVDKLLYFIPIIWLISAVSLAPRIIADFSKPGCAKIVAISKSSRISGGISIVVRGILFPVLTFAYTYKKIYNGLRKRFKGLRTSIRRQNIAKKSTRLLGFVMVAFVICTVPYRVYAFTITASSPSYDPIGDNIRDNSKERVRFAEESSPTPKIFTPDGEEDEPLARDGLLALEKRQRRKTIVNSFRLAELVPTTTLQRHGECLALVNKRLEEENSSPDMFIMRARLHDLFRNSTLCYYDVKDALALDPENEEAQTLMKSLQKRANDSKQQAVQLLLVGKVKEALTKISIALETNPAVPEYHVFRGALHRRKADFNAAIDDFLLAMDKADHDEQNSTYKEAQRQLLLCYNDFAVECFSKGFYDEAIVLLNKSIKGEKNEKGLYINRGDCFFRASELHFALSDYQQALEMDPSDLSDSDGAREDILKCLYLNPNNKEVLSIFSRLFPGRTVNEIINGKLGRSAGRAVEAHIRDTLGPQIPASHARKKKVSNSAFSGKSILPPIRDAMFPEIRSCMEEQDFHINIIKSKKKASDIVKKAFNARQNLSYKGPRVQSTVATIQTPSATRTFKWETSISEKALPSPQTKALTYEA
ncbi:hypothetical protein QZH41_006745 [Actinostola sp. cb2023]|nr:hypothetical protein QZH41_006745 [Actinostola sp. cb2023]